MLYIHMDGADYITTIPAQCRWLIFQQVMFVDRARLCIVSKQFHADMLTYLQSHLAPNISCCVYEKTNQMVNLYKKLSQFSNITFEELEIAVLNFLNPYDKLENIKFSIYVTENVTDLSERHVCEDGYTHLVEYTFELFICSAILSRDCHLFARVFYIFRQFLSYLTIPSKLMALIIQSYDNNIIGLLAKFTKDNAALVTIMQYCTDHTSIEQLNIILKNCSLVPAIGAPQDNESTKLVIKILRIISVNDKHISGIKFILPRVNNDFILQFLIKEALPKNYIGCTKAILGHLKPSEDQIQIILNAACKTCDRACVNRKSREIRTYALINCVHRVCEYILRKFPTKAFAMFIGALNIIAADFACNSLTYVTITMCHYMDSREGYLTICSCLLNHGSYNSERRLFGELAKMAILNEIPITLSEMMDATNVLSAQESANERPCEQLQNTPNLSPEDAEALCIDI